MSDDSEEKKLGFFSRMLGRDITKVPCFRNTFLISISSGLTGGFAYFMYSSKPRKAAHVGYGTFVGVTLSYWVYCRYKWSVDKFQLEQMKASPNYRTLYTEFETNSSKVDKGVTDAK